MVIMRFFVFIVLSSMISCEMPGATQHEPGTGRFPGVPTPVVNENKDVQPSEDPGQIVFLDPGVDGSIWDTTTGPVTLTLRLFDPRDGSPLSGMSLMPQGSSSPSNDEGEIFVEITPNESFSLACTGAGFAPVWLAGTMGSHSTDLSLPLLPESGLDPLLGSIGVQQDPAKANLLINITNKKGEGVAGAQLTHSPESGLSYVITGPTALIGDSLPTSDSRTLGLANITPGVVHRSVAKEDGTPCLVQPGGGSDLPLTLSMAARGSLSFLCP